MIMRSGCLQWFGHVQRRDEYNGARCQTSGTPKKDVETADQRGYEGGSSHYGYHPRS